MSDRVCVIETSGLVLGYLVAVALLTGCDVDPAEAGGGHVHGAGGHGAHDDHGSSSSHEAHGPAHSGVTYTSGYEVFVEYPPLVAGRDAEFSVHLSTIDGYQPVETGSIAVVLTSDSAPGERFTADAPARPGMYRLSVSPEHAGTRHMFVVYHGDDRTVRGSLGEVEIHDQPPRHVHGDTWSDGAISLSKEQQWTVDMATGQVETRALQPSIPGRGIVHPAPDADARLRAPFAGRLLAPDGGVPELGESIEAGQTLAVLVPAVEARVLPTLRAERTKAERELERAERDVQRLEGLVERGAIPRKRLRDARTDRARAEAEVRAARERLEQYRTFERGGRGEGLELRASVDGTIVERSVTVGEYVEAGAALMRTLDDDRLRLEVEVAAANLDRLERPDGVWLKGADGDIVELKGDEAMLSATLPSIDPETRTSSVWFDLPDGSENFIPGQFHRVHLWTREPRETTAVPASALLERKGIWTAYVVEGPESFERRRVEVGMRDGAHVEITEGLDPGERIVTRGAYYVELASTTSGVGGHHH